jgi:hypothetical protein
MTRPTIERLQIREGEPYGPGGCRGILAGVVLMVADHPGRSAPVRPAVPDPVPARRDDGGVVDLGSAPGDLRPGPRWVDGGADRSAWASHRDAGKTVWWFLVLPLWATAHGHRRFVLMLSYTGDQAKAHLANLKAALEDGGAVAARLPAPAPGAPVDGRRRGTAGGARFLAAGLDKTLLGAGSASSAPT